MTKNEIRSAILRILESIAPEVDWSEVDTDSSLRDQVDLDSVDFLNFIVGIHDVIGIDVPEQDYRKLDTLDGCVEYLALERRATAG